MTSPADHEPASVDLAAAGTPDATDEQRRASREWARDALAAARADWTPEKWAQLRARLRPGTAA